METTPDPAANQFNESFASFPSTGNSAWPNGDGEVVPPRPPSAPPSDTPLFPVHGPRPDPRACLDDLYQAAEMEMTDIEGSDVVVAESEEEAAGDGDGDDSTQPSVIPETDEEEGVTDETMDSTPNASRSHTDACNPEHAPSLQPRASLSQPNFPGQLTLCPFPSTRDAEEWLSLSETRPGFPRLGMGTMLSGVYKPRPRLGLGSLLSGPPRPRHGRLFDPPAGLEGRVSGADEPGTSGLQPPSRIPPNPPQKGTKGFSLCV